MEFIADSFLIPATLGAVDALVPRAVQQMRLRWGFDGDLRELHDILTAIQALLRKADGTNLGPFSGLVKMWLKDLKSGISHAEKVLDELEYEAVRRKIEELTISSLCLSDVESRKKDHRSLTIFSACWDWKFIGNLLEKSSNSMRTLTIRGLNELRYWPNILSNLASLEKLEIKLTAYYPNQFMFRALAFCSLQSETSTDHKLGSMALTSVLVRGQPRIRDGSLKNRVWSIKFVKSASEVLMENISRLRTCHFFFCVNREESSSTSPRKLRLVQRVGADKRRFLGAIQDAQGQLFEAEGLPPWRNFVTHYAHWMGT
ncbi:hypothetical protein Vadar_034299 [Vaccinium darrowii]|uniref:Uncharacterized protein n=1 Tax=Vaccinium darrowii TaxID=229202 RepID=A0ACB7ZP76_9ERIC|nr:hypothetical protein Vadar_034299 [Vaccinium darrowii]